MGRFGRTNNFGKRDFGRSNNSGRNGRFDRGDSGRSGGRSDFQLTSVVCAKCGKDCEIPFKPTSNRPVYCRSCFKQTGPSESRNDSGNSRPRYDERPAPQNNGPGPSSKQLEEINRKLDKIIEVLEID